MSFHPIKYPLTELLWGRREKRRGITFIELKCDPGIIKTFVNYFSRVHPALSLNWLYSNFNQITCDHSSFTHHPSFHIMDLIL